MQAADQQTQNQKREWVRNMFSSIAPSYDLLNILLSFNQDKNWKQRAVQELIKNGGDQYLDVATGTADIAIEIAKRTKESCRIDGVDFSAPMLAIGEQKINKAKLGHRIKLQEGDALALKFNSNQFDGTISVWAVRNFADYGKGVAEMYRVLKPGGKMVILEFFKPTAPGWKQLYHFYFHSVTPTIGGLVSGKKYAYEYLPRSVQKFPPMAEFKKIIEQQGFKEVSYTSFFGGIAGMHVGIKR